jgi:chromosomal replication initiation ATPase DnaA
MKQDLGEVVWQAWIKNLSPVALSEKTLVLQASNSFIRDRVQSQYAEKLRFMLKREYGAVQQVSVTVGSAHLAPLAAPAPTKSAPDYPPRLSQMPEVDTPASQNAAELVGGLLIDLSLVSQTSSHLRLPAVLLKQPQQRLTRFSYMAGLVLVKPI